MAAPPAGSAARSAHAAATSPEVDLIEDRVMPLCRPDRACAAPAHSARAAAAAVASAARARAPSWKAASPKVGST